MGRGWVAEGWVAAGSRLGGSRQAAATHPDGNGNNGNGNGNNGNGNGNGNELADAHQGTTSKNQGEGMKQGLMAKEG